MEGGKSFRVAFSLQEASCSAAIGDAVSDAALRIFASTLPLVLPPTSVVTVIIYGAFMWLLCEDRGDITLCDNSNNSRPASTTVAITLKQQPP